MREFVESTESVLNRSIRLLLGASPKRFNPQIRYIPWKDKDKPMRTLMKTAFRLTNKLLSIPGLKIERLNEDFSIFPIDEFSQQRMFNELAESYDNWFERQTILQSVVTFDTLIEVKNFFEAWKKSPFKKQTGSSRFNNLLWLFLISKRYAPKIIIDSGTFEGASAWALKLGCPDAEILSFDIDLSQLKLKAAGVSYFEADWASTARQWNNNDRVLVYFDDHVDQAKRLLEAQHFGCSLVIFDDDYPLTSYFNMAPSPSVLPKVEFVLDPSLQDGQVLKWGSASGAVQQWVVNTEYLKKARDCIEATERLPFTGLITGIHQTPYRLVRIRQPIK